MGFALAQVLMEESKQLDCNALSGRLLPMRFQYQPGNPRKQKFDERSQIQDEHVQIQGHDIVQLMELDLYLFQF